MLSRMWGIFCACHSGMQPPGVVWAELLWPPDWGGCGSCRVHAVSQIMTFELWANRNRYTRVAITGRPTLLSGSCVYTSKLIHTTPCGRHSVFSIKGPSIIRITPWGLFYCFHSCAIAASWNIRNWDTYWLVPHDKSQLIMFVTILYVIWSYSLTT